MRRRAIVIVVLLGATEIAACSAFGAADDKPNTAQDGSAANGDAALEGSSLTDAIEELLPPDPNSFCAAKKDLFLCEDFDRGFRSDWEKPSNQTFMSIFAADSAHVQSARVELTSARWAAGITSDTVGRVVGRPAGRYVVELALRVDAIPELQIIELVALKVDSVTKLQFHLALNGTKLLLAEFNSGGFSQKELGVVGLGQWHRVKFDVSYADRKIAGQFDGDLLEETSWNQVDATIPMPAFTDLGLWVGLHDTKEFIGETRYFIDDLTVQKSP